MTRTEILSSFEDLRNNCSADAMFELSQACRSFRGRGRALMIELAECLEEMESSFGADARMYSEAVDCALAVVARIEADWAARSAAGRN